MTLSNSLESEFGVPVPVADIIKGPTINELINGVFQELLQGASPHLRKADGQAVAQIETVA